MHALDPLPDAFETAAQALGQTAESRRITALSPLTRTGAAGTAALIVSDQAVSVLEQNGSETVETVIHAPMSSIQGMRLHPLTGGGVIVMKVDGDTRETLRTLPGAAGLFGGIAGAVDKHIAKPAPAFKPKKKDVEPVVKPVESKPLDFTEAVEKYKEDFRDKYKEIIPEHWSISGKKMTRRAIVLRVLEFAKGFHHQLIFLFVLITTVSAMQLIGPFITKWLIDDVFGSTAALSGAAGLPFKLLLAVGLMFFVMIVNASLHIVHGRLAAKVGADITHGIRMRAFSHLETLSLSYFNKHQTGAIMSRINSDTQQLQGFLTDGVQYTLSSILLLIFTVSVLLWMDWRLGLLVLLPMPFAVIISKLVWRTIFRNFRKLWESFSRISAFLNDSLSGIRVVKAFGQEQREISQFEMHSSESRDRAVTAQQTWQTLLPILNVIIQLSVLFVWYFGGRRVLSDSASPKTDAFTLGSLMAFIGWLHIMYGPLQLLTRLNDWLTRSLSAAERIFEILDTEPKIVTNPDAAPVERINGDIEFKDVSFGYEAHKPVLKGVSFKLGAGKMLGLVGHSGAGKSTTTNLILRLFDVDAGTILIDGRDIRDYRLEDLRNSIAIVLQDVFLFTGTIRENLLYACPKATKEDIIQAAMDANAHEFIMNKPDGYDTLLGEHGEGLSGGEKQRIAVARALLKNPRILILDEATSSVDTETEMKIQTALQRLVEGRTTIAIAHRLSTLRYADRLIVMKEGDVIESGSHNELMDAKGEYYRLVTVQTDWAKQIAVGR
ncbi:MAG: ABC transporter ATP-binding protein [Planctomycetota bacterium]